MKFIERLGAFSLSNVWFWPIMIGIVTSIIVSSLPKTVTLNSKHWECISTVPDGIDAICTGYKFRGK